jgi:hypothetical protein
VPNALIPGKVTDMEYPFFVQASGVFPETLEGRTLCAMHK